jgi:hypothetical protein
MPKPTTASAAPPRRKNNNRNTRPSKRRPTRSRWPLFGIVALVVAAVVIVAVVLSDSSTPNHAAINATTPQGVKYYGGLGPEGVPVQIGTVLAPRNPALTGQSIDGISCSSQEQLAFHHHVHLAIFVNGALRPVPLGLGMAGTLQTSNATGGEFADGASTCLYWLHVHAQDGIVHIESPVARQFYLGQVFALWGQPLSMSQVGPEKGTVTATVNGQPWTGDPSQIPLDEHNQIVLNVGTPVVAPIPISWSGTGL